MMESSERIVSKEGYEREMPNEEEAKPSMKTLRWIQAMICLISLSNNFDTGVIPASLIQIENELHLSFSQLATLGSLEYLGLSIATFVVPVLFNRYPINIILAVTCFFNGILSLSIALTSSITLIYAARLGQGFCAAFGVIYGPIWINHFSPPEKTATWMGIVQASVPLGVMIGYSGIAVIYTVTKFENSWRIGFAFLFVLTTITAVFFSLIPNEYIDVLQEEKLERAAKQRGASTAASHRLPSRRLRLNSHADSEFNDSLSLVSYESTFAQGFIETFKQYGPILRHHIYIYACLGLCVLFYIVTGIQYWATEYFVKFTGASPSQAMASFSILAISAPISGAIIGGKISDHLGGYKGKNRITALKFCVSVGLAAFIFCIPIGYVVEQWQLVVLLWFLLAFGGALIPNGTGICLSCLPKQYHSACSSLSQLIFNVGGYFLCPIVSGTIMDQFPDKQLGLVWGWRSVVIMGILAPFFFMKALYNEASNPCSDYDEDERVVNEDITRKQPKKEEQTIEIQKRTKAWSVL